MDFETIDDIRRANIRHGGKWFSPVLLNYHRTRFVSDVLHGNYFIISARLPGVDRRYYWLHHADERGTITTVVPNKKFRGFSTVLRAKAYLDSIVGKAHEVGKD